MIKTRITAILDLYLDEDTMYTCFASNAVGIAAKSVFVTGNRLIIMHVNKVYSTSVRRNSPFNTLSIPAK
jgi:hypothetical protein